ncbi:MAG: nicotinate (nicotinamide) nucleotide adenylyltransferase [Lautropia sp.]
MTQAPAAAAARTRLGLLGGSFDPIHVGHLALGRAADLALALDELRFVPAGLAWQKHGDPGAPARTPARHRLAMTRIALASGTPAHWRVDDIEVRRSGPTYTVETLEALRADVGPEVALILILGSDQLRNLPSWHRWRDLLRHAHIAVTTRERVRLDALPAEVDALVRDHGEQALPDAAGGSIVLFTMPPVAVSATGIRAQLSRGEDPAALLPVGVIDYIRANQLYGTA